MFLHRSTLRAIACGRGSGGSRYVDMVLTLDDTTIEFTNIHRDELNVLNTYIHSILIPAMKKDANEDEEMLDEVEVYDTSRKRTRTERKASKEARKATRAELDHHEESDSQDDEEDWEEANHDEEFNDESDDDEDEVENSDGEVNVMEDVADDSLGNRKRTQRKASLQARQATKAELCHHEESDSEGDEEDWEELQLDEESGDESDKGEELDAASIKAIVDDADEQELFDEEEFFEEESGTATESDDEGESSPKKARSWSRYML